MTTDLTARIEAQERFLELYRAWKETEWVDESDALAVADILADAAADAVTRLLTALEQAEGRNAATIETLNVCQAALGSQAGQADMQRTIGAARLNLAKKALKESRAGLDLAEQRAEFYESHLNMSRSMRELEERERAEQAEARVEKAEAEVFEVLKRVDVTERRAEKAEAALAASETEVGRLQFVLSATEEDLNDAADALAAERAKRCETCKWYDWDVLGQQWACPILEAADDPDDFGCTDWQPREATQ